MKENRMRRDCPACRRKFNALKDLRNRIGNDAELNSFMGADENRAASERKSRLGNGPARLLPGIRFPKIRLPLAAASLLVIAVVIAAFFHIERPARYRAIDPGTLQLLEPKAVVTRAPTRFRWVLLEGEQIDYTLKIINQDLNTVFSRMTKQDRIDIPPEIRNKLQTGVKYVWTVTATDDQPRKVASGSRTLEIR